MVMEDNMEPWGLGFHTKGDWCNKSSDVRGWGASADGAGRAWRGGTASTAGKWSVCICNVAGGSAFMAKPEGRLGKGGVKGAFEPALRGGKNCRPKDDAWLLWEPGLSNMGGGVLPSAEGTRADGLSSTSPRCCKDGCVVEG